MQIVCICVLINKLLLNLLCVWIRSYRYDPGCFLALLQQKVKMKARGVKLLIETLTQQGNYNRLSKQSFSPWIRQSIGPSGKKKKKKAR